MSVEREGKTAISIGNGQFEDWRGPEDALDISGFEQLHSIQQTFQFVVDPFLDDQDSIGLGTVGQRNLLLISNQTSDDVLVQVLVDEPVANSAKRDDFRCLRESCTNKHIVGRLAASDVGKVGDFLLDKDLNRTVETLDHDRDLARNMLHLNGLEIDGQRIRGRG